jgi:DNA-nicking Smr family endonuclease
VVSGDDREEDQDVVELPIDGILDLHAFAPRDVKDLVETYLDECRGRGILEVRIIHGKGTGTLRRVVHAILRRRADVQHFALAGGDRGGWGATLVTLRR